MRSEASKARIRIYQREYMRKRWRERKDCPEFREKARAIRRAHYQKNRDQVIQLYGAKCAICGFDDVRALQLDHIENDGYTERTAGGRNLDVRHIQILKDPEYAKRFQLLCANHNWIKRAEYEESCKAKTKEQ